jgi:ABC-2 type transport system ATP-binding protein
VLGEVISTLTGQGSHLVSLQKREPTLEDVFVELVGRGFSGDEDQGQDAA